MIEPKIIYKAYLKGTDYMIGKLLSLRKYLAENIVNY